MLGVTGSIAAYKTAMLASLLVKQHADVHVLMTANATKFISPLTFETLTSNKCVVDTFDRNFSYDVKHVSLAKKADLFMIAPCSANVIGKLAFACREVVGSCHEYRYVGEQHPAREYRKAETSRICDC